MDSMFTTKKGTKLPLLNLKGKSYLQVAYRLVFFREDHPLGRISCSLVSVTDTSAVVRAEIYVMGQKPDGSPFETLLSSAHKKETEEHFGDFIEKAETGAIGRALAMAGYGTQFEPELDEGQRLADSPIAVPLRTSSDNSSKPGGATKIVPPKSAPATEPTNRKAVNEKISLTSKVIIDSKRDTQDNVVKMLTEYGVKTKEELNDEQASKLLKQLEDKLK